MSDHRVLLQSLHLPSVPSTENLCAAMPAEEDDSVSSRDLTPGESWSLALQVEVLHTPQLRTLWSHLRPAFLHYTTDMDGANFVPKNQEAAHQHMLEYSRLAQSYVGDSLMTWKLHSIICR